MLSSVYIKTDTGRQAFKARLPGIPPKLRSAFILFDGTRTLGAVFAATAGLGITETDVMALVERGYLAVSSESSSSAHPAASAAPPMPPAPIPPTSTLTWQQERFKLAYPLAAQLTAGLGLRGFRLHLAVEGAQNYDQLLLLSSKIREAVGVGKSQAFEQALGDGLES